MTNFMEQPIADFESHMPAVAMSLTEGEIKVIAAMQPLMDSSRMAAFKNLADAFNLTDFERRELPGKLHRLGVAR